MRYIFSDSKTWYNLKSYVRKNRNNPTNAEKIIWENVRKNQLGYRFRRQHAVYHFIVDFICIEKKLIIEIDGVSHENKKDDDDEREKILTEMGFKVIRFSNDEVLGNCNKVIKRIKDILAKQ